jgi:WD40 repeat protein
MSKQIVDNQVGEILYLSFNQDLSRLSCGTDIGFMVYDTNPMKIQFQKNFNAGIGIVEAMYKSNILALVGGGKTPFHPPNKCILWDDKESTIVSELEYRECVRGVKMTKDALVVATDDIIRVYDIKNELNMLHKIKCGLNYGGLMELSISSDKPLLISPLKDVGKVALINYTNPQKKELGQIQCCKHPIRAIRLNNDGTKFAVVSEFGTIIRIFDVETQKQINPELRRGTEKADIQTVYFSDDSKFLLVACDKGTIHIYSLTDEYNNTKSSLNMISGVLPTYFSSVWSMNKIVVPHNKYVAGIVKRKNTGEDLYDISVFMSDGNYHHYEFAPETNSLQIKKESNFISLSE